jgi:hypothetical protein
MVPTRHVEIWDGVYLHQLLKAKGRNLPNGPVTVDEELGKGPPVLVEYDDDHEMLKKKSIATYESETCGAESVEPVRASTKLSEDTLREDEATERYLKANKIPFVKEDGIYIVEKYSHARSRTRKKYKNLMLRKEYIEWKVRKRT